MLGRVLGGPLGSLRGYESVNDCINFFLVWYLCSLGTVRTRKKEK